MSYKLKVGTNSAKGVDNAEGRRSQKYREIMNLAGENRLALRKVIMLSFITADVN